MEKKCDICGDGYKCIVCGESMCIQHIGGEFRSRGYEDGYLCPTHYKQVQECIEIMKGEKKFKEPANLGEYLDAEKKWRVECHHYSPQEKADTFTDYVKSWQARWERDNELYDSPSEVLVNGVKFVPEKPNIIGPETVDGPYRGRVTVFLGGYAVWPAEWEAPTFIAPEAADALYEHMYKARMEAMYEKYGRDEYIGRERGA